ncbi:MAG: GNAT family N-acetyltransferase [Roseovarius sp.]
MTHPTSFHETAPSGPTADLAARFQALIPVLETDRLILRAPRIEDFDGFATMVCGERGTYFGHPGTRADAWQGFMQITGTWALRGHGAWAVTDRATGTLLGFVQLGAEPGDLEPELGWIVSAEAEGKGIAHEAAEAVRAHALGAFALPSLVSYIDARNTRSCTLADRLGARRDPAAEAAIAGLQDDGEHCVVYRHQMPEGR